MLTSTSSAQSIAMKAIRVSGDRREVKRSNGHHVCHGVEDATKVSEEDKIKRVWSEREGPRRIEVSITVQSVENIDNSRETVDVGMLLDVYWLPSAEELEENGSKGSSWDFESNMQTVNAIVDNERVIRKKPRLKDSSGIKKWYAQLWISSTFKQRFDLHSFPFDCQRLVCRFEMGKVENMIYVPPVGRAVMCSVERELCPLTEWSWQGASVVTTGTDRSLSKQGNSYAQMIVIFHLARVWEPYFWRIGLFVMLVLCSSMMAYVVDPVDDFSTRISVLLTLILTQIAFTFTIQGVLPNEPYLSLIEQYTLLSIFVLFATSAWTSIVKAVAYKSESDWRSGDDVVAIVHLVSLLVIHALIVVKCMAARKREMAAFREGSSSWISKPRANIQVRTTKARGSDEFDDSGTSVYSS